MFFPTINKVRSRLKSLSSDLSFLSMEYRKRADDCSKLIRQYQVERDVSLDSAGLSDRLSAALQGVIDHPPKK